MQWREGSLCWLKLLGYLDTSFLELDPEDVFFQNIFFLNKALYNTLLTQQMKYWNYTIIFLYQFNLLIWNACDNKELRDCRYCSFSCVSIFP